MTIYFHLVDDMLVANRWHLGEIADGNGAEPSLRAGVWYDGCEALSVPVTKAGRVLDFSLTSFGVPVLSNKLAEAIREMAMGEVQSVPVTVAGQAGMSALNVVQVLHCLDEPRSEFIKWTDRDHRADLAGQYRQVTKLALAKRDIPPDTHVFRIKGWLIAIVVSEQIKKLMEREGCLGAKFIELE